MHINIKLVPSCSLTLHHYCVFALLGLSINGECELQLFQTRIHKNDSCCDDFHRGNKCRDCNELMLQHCSSAAGMSVVRIIFSFTWCSLWLSFYFFSFCRCTKLNFSQHLLLNGSTWISACLQLVFDCQVI